jgi:hypothetical protein
MNNLSAPKEKKRTKKFYLNKFSKLEDELFHDN